jgi:hypothetical protein
MKNIFLSIAVAATACVSAQNPTQSTRPVNRASEWSKASAAEDKKIDSSKLVKKTVTQEIALPKALDVLIDMSGELIINTWNENKMKIETTVQFEGPNELTDSQWLEKIGINMKLFGSTVRVKTRANSGGVTFLTGNGTRTVYTTSYATSSLFYNNGNYLNTQRGSVTLYIPAQSILEIESKNGRLKINNNIKSLLLDNTDGEIEFANIDRLQLRSNRGSFNGGIVGEADIELSHGRLSLKQINKGDVTSNYSTIEIETLKDVKLSSSTDEIDIDNASALYGIKNYGNLRINQLTGTLDLQGINSDIKLRHINPSVQLVKIVNRNADLRLPSGDLSNLSVDIKGSYNKIYSSFADKTTIDTLTNAEAELVKSMTNIATTAGPARTTGTTFNLYAGGGNVVNVPAAITGQVIGTSKQNPNLKYSAKIGTGNALKYEIICTSCVIDFK